MIYLSNKSLADDFTGDWIGRDNFKNPFQSVSIQIDWASVVGTPDGKIYIELSAEPDNSALATKIAEIDLNSTATGDDDVMVQLNYQARAVRIKYAKNHISGGTMNVNVLFE